MKESILTVTLCKMILDENILCVDISFSWIFSVIFGACIYKKLHFTMSFRFDTFVNSCENKVKMH